MFTSVRIKILLSCSKVGWFKASKSTKFGDRSVKSGISGYTSPTYKGILITADPPT